MVDRAVEVATAARLARRAIEIGRDDAVALSFGGHAVEVARTTLLQLRACPRDRCRVAE
jgi:hypothetical protein